MISVNTKKPICVSPSIPKNQFVCWSDDKKTIIKNFIKRNLYFLGQELQIGKQSLNWFVLDEWIGIQTFLYRQIQMITKQILKHWFQLPSYSSYFSFLLYCCPWAHIWIIWYANIGKLGGNVEREKRKKKCWLKNLFIYTRKWWFTRIRKSKLPLYQYEFDMFSWLRRRHWIWVRREFKCGSLAAWTCQIALNSKHLLFFLLFISFDFHFATAQFVCCLSSRKSYFFHISLFAFASLLWNPRLMLLKLGRVPLKKTMQEKCKCLVQRENKVKVDREGDFGFRVWILLKNRLEEGERERMIWL